MLPQFRILILEDNPLDAELVQRQLRQEKLSFVFKRVENQEEFIRQLEEFSPTVILSDYSLPQYSGLEALHYVRSRNLHIPFILVTGSQSEEIAVACIREGADDYLLKSSLIRLPNAVLNAYWKKEMEREKERAEAELLRQRDLYETLLTAQSDAGLGFAVVEHDSGHVMFVNDALCRIGGYSREELLNLPSFFRLISHDDLDRVRTFFERQCNEKASPSTMETKLVHKQTQSVHIELGARRLRSELPRRTIIIVRDISERVKLGMERKLAQEAIRESERRFRVLIEEVEEYAIIMLDPMGRVASWNVGAERIFAYREAEILLQPWSRFSPPEAAEQDAAIRSLHRATQEGRVNEEGWCLRKNGSRFWASVITTALRTERGELIGFSCIIRDLTERKKAEDELRLQGEQLRALASHLQTVREEERTRIARELHDELGQMLTALRMDLSILDRWISRSVAEPDQSRFHDKVASISGLVEATIQATRKIVTELRPAVLDELGLQIALQWQAQEFENRTGIRCKLTRLSTGFPIDQKRSTALFRIFQEALTNIARHSGATNVLVRLEKVGENVVLHVKDNGKGISQRDQKDVTSSGLLGMRERVLSFGGEIHVEGGTGMGTALTVTIPLHSKHDSSSA